MKKTLRGFLILSIPIVVLLVVIYILGVIGSAKAEELKNHYSLVVESIEVPKEISNSESEIATQKFALEEAEGVLEALQKDLLHEKKFRHRDEVEALIESELYIIRNARESIELVIKESESRELQQKIERRKRARELRAEIETDIQKQRSKQAQERIDAIRDRTEKERLEKERAEADARAKKEAEAKKPAPKKESGTSNSGTSTPETQKPTPEPKVPEEEPDLPMGPKPTMGEVSKERQNRDQWIWEFGELKYIWSEEYGSWSIWWRYGMNVTDRDRWFEDATKAFPKPSKDGKYDEETVDHGTLFIFYGERFY